MSKYAVLIWLVNFLKRKRNPLVIGKLPKIRIGNLVKRCWL